MRCSYCKGKIGFWRGLSDREYCNEEHRRRGRNVTARQARESLIYGDEELYEVGNEERKQKQKHSKLQAQIIVVLSTVMIGVLAFSAATGSSGGTLHQRTVSLTGELSRSSPLLSQATNYIKSMLPSSPPVRIHDDFTAGIVSWMGARTSDWSVAGGTLRPAGLRVWKPSVQLSDYRLEFEGQIDRNAMSWAFRAPDLRNYYATKIVLKKTSGATVADLVRYTVLNGAERDRLRLPLPIAIQPDTLYHVQMSVRGDQFITKVNGQVVDSWKDNRLKRGGIGFFSDKGETASIHWVDVREERDGIFNRLFSLGFFVLPVAFETLD
ncbi:hypothetical protein [Bryobacter aggregatus]|uniref:hypothetical protein n=1 Tax=Bryobacter aggregatus TaxID=360054 RepID=UPI0004E16E9B|nr:hypothetical protein [Bryobacter aggregatus]